MRRPLSGGKNVGFWYRQNLQGPGPLGLEHARARLQAQPLLVSGRAPRHGLQVQLAEFLARPCFCKAQNLY
jgi:hypothetical protein